MFGYLEGRAAVTPRERAAARTDEALVEVARLVREFHDLTHGTALAGDQDVVCHNDLAPKNTVYTAWRPTALIDWDLAAPGERIHDLAHVCWQYLDLGPGVTDVRDTARRIRLICDAYGLDGRDGLLDTVLWWQDRCRSGIEGRSAAGVSPPWSGCVLRAPWRRCGPRGSGVAGHRRELDAFLE